ncbi:substrate-binding domain-containing protein [Nodosilinea sp. PGN35]|uniref:substrate-binding domain-containing protein n=1 Tax=Nodosilinea sp. PGN35 TaxID=3020489 RepID=UPI00398B1C86
MAENDWAIVIGINEYDFLSADDHLKYAVNDAMKVRQFLCEQAKFPQENVLLCCDRAPGSSLQQRPSRNGLRHLLKNEIQRAKGAHNFWFFYAGHGIVHEHCDFLLPCDGNPRDLRDTAIPISFVTDCLRDCGANHVVLVMDMCRNRTQGINEGSRDIGEVVGEQTQQIAKAQGIVTLFSCSRNERSYEIGDLEQGAFTYALLEGLKQSTTPRALEIYLTQRVPALNFKHGKPIQTPMVIPEPGFKYDRPLLLSCATPADIQQLAVEARDAELEEQDYEKAKRLWWQVIEADRSTSSDRVKARKAIDRINYTIHQRAEDYGQRRAENATKEEVEPQRELEQKQKLEQEQEQLKRETDIKQRQVEEQDRNRRKAEELKRQQAEAEKAKQEESERQRMLEQQRQKGVQTESTVQLSRAISEEEPSTTPLVPTVPVIPSHTSVSRSQSSSPSTQQTPSPTSQPFTRRQVLKWAIPGGVGFVGVVLVNQLNTEQSQRSVTQGSDVVIYSSSSMQRITEELKQSFEKQYSNIVAKVILANSNEAVAAVAAGKGDLAAIGRPLTEAEKAEGLVTMPISRIKIAIIVGLDNPFSGDLTMDDFAQIFRGEITDWSEVGGPQSPIRLVDRPSTSDTREAFRSYSVFQVAPFETSPGATRLSEDSIDAVIQALGNDGIGYASFSEVVGRRDVRILPMHQTLPDDPRYPFSQPSYFVYKGTEPSAETKTFLEYIDSNLE